VLWSNDLYLVTVPFGAFVEGSPGGMPVGLAGMGSVVVRDYLYILGGTGGSNPETELELVWRGRIAANGDVETVGPSPGGDMTRPRGDVARQVQLIGDFVYVFGGLDASGSTLATVERAPVDSSGNLGAFADAAQGGLIRPRRDGAAVRVGRYVYLLGGRGTGGAAQDEVERAPILDGQGNLGPFEDYSSSSRLGTPLYGHAAIVANGKVFVAGGTAAGASQVVVQAATVLDADGNIGAFAPAGNLVLGRTGLGLAVVGSDLLVLGGAGTDGTLRPNAELAPLAADGALGSFALDAGGGQFYTDGLPLRVPRRDFGLQVARGNLYAIGGRAADGGPISDIERAAIPDGGATGSVGVEVR